MSVIDLKVPRAAAAHSGMIKRVNLHEPHVLQIYSSARRSRSCLTSPRPRRTAELRALRPLS